jgi:hypothetical protein
LEFWLQSALAMSRPSACNLRAEIAPVVKGSTFASWTVRAHDLTGKPVVKISLKTGDKQLAQPTAQL